MPGHGSRSLAERGAPIGVDAHKGLGYEPDARGGRVA